MKTISSLKSILGHKATMQASKILIVYFLVVCIAPPTLFSWRIRSNKPCKSMKVCENNDCQSGTCKVDRCNKRGYSCSCFPGYSGDNCEGIDGGWSLWGDWSSCTKTCGTGTRSRSRSCNNPSPQNGGTDCHGQSEDSSSCNTQTCSMVDGGWSSWGVWSSCTKTCDTGTSSRSRSCTNPSPQNGGGGNCSGPSEETLLCNTQGC